MQKVKDKLEYWMEKYEKDTAAKDEETDDLKTLKAENLETMQRFAKEVRHQQHINIQPCKTALGFFLYHSDKDHRKKSVILRHRL